MARYNKYGFAVDQIIAEDLALPNATNLVATNTVQIPAVGSGLLKVIVCSSDTETEIANAATMTITPLFGTTATTCTVRAMGGIYLIGGDVTLNNSQGSITSTDNPNPLTWASGALIAEFYIPPRLCKAYDYMEINIACSANESADNVEIYLVVED